MLRRMFNAALWLGWFCLLAGLGVDFLGVPVGAEPTGAGTHTLTKLTVQVDGRPFEVEVALTPHEKAQGLMYRKSLGGKQGMVFPFEQAAVQSAWMKNCVIPLDILFFRDGRLVYWYDQVPPCPKDQTHCPQYGSKVPVDMMLELKAGTRKRYGWKAQKTMITPTTKDMLVELDE